MTDREIRDGDIVIRKSRYSGAGQYEIVQHFEHSSTVLSLHTSDIPQLINDLARAYWSERVEIDLGKRAAQ